MKNKDNKFENLHPTADEIRAFAKSIDNLYLIMLKDNNKGILRYTPLHPERLEEWFKAHNIRQVQL